jgi:hypothetical protein
MDPLIIYNLVNSPWTWIFLTVWILIGVTYTSKLKELIERLVFLATKPLIFDVDHNHDKPPLYPRTILERVARGITSLFQKAWGDTLKPIIGFVESQNSIVYDEDHRLRTYAYPFLLLCTLAFLYADLIAISAAVALIMPPGTVQIPEWLIHYEHAVTIATFLSAIISFLVLTQVFSKVPSLMRPVDNDTLRALIKVVAMAVVAVALFAGVFINIGKLIEMKIIPASEIVTFIVNLSAHVLILANGTLSAAIIFADGFIGLVVVLIVVLWIFIGISYPVFYIFKALVYIVFFLVDIGSRIVYVLIDVLLYCIFVPFLAIITLIQMPFKLILGAGKQVTDD